MERDVDKVLDRLIHDLRTPLGVAMGYVRLIKDDRLASAEERDRALANTIEALGRIWRLCEEAEGSLAAARPPAPGSEENA